jgi:hypothetical protein
VEENFLRKKRNLEKIEASDKSPSAQKCVKRWRCPRS